MKVIEIPEEADEDLIVKYLHLRDEVEQNKKQPSSSPDKHTKTRKLAKMCENMTPVEREIVNP